MSSPTQAAHIYLVQTERIVSLKPKLIFTDHLTAHAERAAAKSEAEQVAAQHRDYHGAEQTFSGAWPDYQKFWRTTYPNGLWQEVRIVKVKFGAAALPKVEETTPEDRSTPCD